MTKLIRLIILTGMTLTLLVSTSHSGTGRTRKSSVGHDYSDTRDIEAEILFGRDLAARILANYKVSRNDDLIRYVNLVGKGLSLFSGRPELRFRFIVLDTDEINAFATPGGYVFITTGALKKMDNEAQLACVLGHEISHVILRHVVRRFNIRGDDESAFSALTGAVGSTTTAFKNTLGKAMDGASTIFFETGYTIREEMEADNTGMMIAQSAGYDPNELSTFLLSCKGFEKKGMSNEGDHPQVDARIEAMGKILVQNGVDKQKAAKVRRRFHEYVK